MIFTDMDQRLLGAGNLTAQLRFVCEQQQWSLISMRKAILAAAVALAPIAGLTTAAVAADHSKHEMPTTAPAFVAAAGASDLYEIESSQMALQKATSTDVRQFAQMLVDHHTKTTEDVTKAAKQAELNPPPPALMPKQERMIAELTPLTGVEFERAYLRQQVPAHEEALALHTKYMNEGDAAPLKAAASRAVPIVKDHLTRAKQLNASSR